MAKNVSVKKALLLGSGGLRIGQAGEFDYSGSQAIKALKEEGIQVILINPNIATVQTQPDFVDALYLEPLTVYSVSKIIEKEKPDAILLGFGGQTALNLGLALEAEGILEKHNIQVLGSPVETIRISEDRDLFKQALAEVDIKTPRSISVNTVAEALAAADEIGYPVMMRSGFSLGGLGSGRVESAEELKIKATETLHAVPQILIEEYLLGWKEFEYEIVRDNADNALTICNMENMDPMGVHTGESIVVAPSQTLNNKEYHKLRSIAIKAAKLLKIVGECNIQYAVDPATGDYRVVEMNARLSRSSALASKATGYPLAFIATKLALGYTLPELTNQVTGKTCAFFEPALDYVVVKIPRWDTHKLKTSDRTIGTEMKSVGEVMAIGRSFPEALQKAVGMLNQGASGLYDYPDQIAELEKEIQYPTDRRLYAIAQYFRKGGTEAQVHELSKIDPWFVNQLYRIISYEKVIAESELDKDTLLLAKRLGFSDKTIAALSDSSEDAVREQRLQQGVQPWVKQIDTLAGEFAAETNYLYLTYHGDRHDIEPASDKAVVVLGSGPYSIGSSVEFDWCAVNTARTLTELGKASILINCNPETVSTDYDESNRLYFEQLSFERVQDIADFEKPEGIVVSVGGQVANNLVLPLARKQYPLLGTKPEKIDNAEDRGKFSALLNELNIDQPEWIAATSLTKAKSFAQQVGYPVLIRPSYVLSGAAMNVVANESELEDYLAKATAVSREHPVVISQFITEAKELEVDGVAAEGRVLIEAISEHVENAGVHSGDATIVLPPQQLYMETIRRTKKITRKIVKALEVTGPFNIQFLAKDNEIKVIECNVRASRSFPFVSKVTDYPFIAFATKVLLGERNKPKLNTLDLDYVGVKAPQFSYNRLKGSDPIAHVEMASTGEVACLGDDLLEAFYKSWLATEQKVASKRLFVSIWSEKKAKLYPYLKQLEDNGWELYTTEGTHDFLSHHGVASNCVFKASERIEPNVTSMIQNHDVDLIINIPGPTNASASSDGYVIRRLAIDHHIPLITNLQIAQLMLRYLATRYEEPLPVKSWDAYIHGVDA